MELFDTLFDDAGIKKENQRKFCQFIGEKLPVYQYCLIPDEGETLQSDPVPVISEKIMKRLKSKDDLKETPFTIVQEKPDVIIACYEEQLAAIFLVVLPELTPSGVECAQYMVSFAVEAFFSNQALEEEQELAKTRKEQVKRKFRLLEKKNMEILTQNSKQHEEYAALLKSEIKRQTKDIEKARQTAEDANESKSEFLANMSHEIRTPMNGVTGMLQILSDTRLSQEQQGYVESASQSAGALLTLINDILDFSKIEAGKLDIEIIDFNLKTMMDAVIDMLAPKAFEKGLELFYLIGKDISKRLSGDPTRIRQILINLIGNAIKFTRKGNVFVNIQIKKETKKTCLLLFEVKDTGIGIPADETDKLFQLFTQVDASTTRKFGGTGLGLAISKQLTELMGGEIGVTSELNEGSVFWFTIKLKKLKMLSPEAEIERKNTAEEKNVSISTRLNILLAEDNIVNQKVVSIMLGKMGHTITVAGDGLQALELFEKENFDLILMDIQMPVMDGEEATVKIRTIEEETKTHTPIIALTANVMKGDKEQYLKCGMDQYVSKPIRKNDLIQAIQVAIG